jgi:hypothetical protein
MTNDGIAKSLLILESDLAALGWDQPAALYEVHGDFDDDPTFVKLAELTDPRYDLMAMAASVRAGDAITGLVLATEAWRPITYDEALVSQDEELQSMVEFIQTVILPAGIRLQEQFGETHIDPEKALREAWMKAIVETCHGHIGNLPDRLKREIRTLIAVNRRGEVLGANRARGEEPELTDVANAHEAGVIPDLLATVLGV